MAASDDTSDPVVTYRNAEVADFKGIVRVLAETPAAVEDSKFFDNLRVALEKKHIPGESGRFNCMVAELSQTTSDGVARKAIVGSIVVTSFNVSIAREKGDLKLELYGGVSKDHEIVVVRSIGVHPVKRKNGIGNELLYAGVRSLAASPTVQAIIAYVPVENEDANSFFEDVHFRKYGIMPAYLKQLAARSKDAKDGYSGDAYLWVSPLRGNELVEYACNGKRTCDEESLIDLSAVDITKHRVRRMPKWLRDMLLQFILPLGAVVFIFAISYMLVVFGPLQGIGDSEWFKDVVRTPPQRAAEDAAASSGGSDHSFDSPDEYVEL